MSSATFVALLSVWFAAIASPGPDVFQIIRIGSRNRAAGIRCALGIMIGNTVWIVSSLLGLSAVMNTHPELLNTLKFLGGSFLIWMGVKAIWAGVKQPNPPTHISETADASPACGGAWAQVRIGLLTNLANPKAVVFFGAVFAQFVTPGMGSAASALVAVTLIVTGIAWFVGVALGVGVCAGGVAAHWRYIEIVSGIVFVVLGGAMLWAAAGALMATP